MRAINILQRIDSRGPTQAIADGLRDLKSSLGLQMTPIVEPTTMTEIVENAKTAGEVFTSPVKDLVQSIRRRI